MASPLFFFTTTPTPISSTCTVLAGDASGFAIEATCTGAPPTTANVFQHGCKITQTDGGSGNQTVYFNTGTSASPVWNPIAVGGINGAGLPSIPFFLLDNGSANAVVVTAYAVGTTFVPLSTGLLIAVRLKNTLQAGANTVNFNGTTKNLKMASDPAANLHTQLLAGGTLTAIYYPGVAGGIWEAIGTF